MHRILNKVRKTMEIYAKQSDFDPNDLFGLCAITSVFLARKLPHSRIVVGVFGYLGNRDPETEPNHCWVERNNSIIDLTARQFDDRLPKVLILPRSSRRFKFGKYVTTVKDFKAWPPHQKPLSKVLRKLENIYQK